LPSIISDDNSVFSFKNNRSDFPSIQYYLHFRESVTTVLFSIFLIVDLAPFISINFLQIHDFPWGIKFKVHLNLSICTTPNQEKRKSTSSFIVFSFWLVLNVAAVMRSLLFGQVAFFRVITEVIQ
jgi:hypothetical protein